MKSSITKRASARILGRDMGRLLTETSRPIVERVLSQEPDKGPVDALATLMIRNSANYYGDYDMGLSLLTGVANWYGRG